MVKLDDIKIGDILYSEYTNKKYLVSCLPKLIDNKDMFALIRLDGGGYCYLCDDLMEVKKYIYYSGEYIYLCENDELKLIDTL